MKQRKKSKYLHEGQYVVEVEVRLVEDDTGWSPYLSVEDAYKLDDVREALRREYLESAAKYGRIYELRPWHINNGITSKSVGRRYTLPPMRGVGQQHHKTSDAGNPGLQSGGKVNRSFIMEATIMEVTLDAIEPIKWPRCRLEKEAQEAAR